MKKCVLSAAVLGLMVPAIYAMDGAEPAVEIEVPAVELTVDVVEAPIGELNPVDVAIEDLPKPEIDVTFEEVAIDLVAVEGVELQTFTTEMVQRGEPDCVLLGPPEQIGVDGEVVEKITTDEMVEFDPLDCGVAVDENGNQIWLFGAPTLEGEVVEGEAIDPRIFQSGLPLDENGEPVAFQTFGGGVEGGEGTGEVPVYYFMRGGELPQLGAPGEFVEGETVDPNLVDLASQSGVAFGDGSGEVTTGEMTTGDEVLVRNNGEIQPHFRSLSAAPAGGGGDEALMSATGGNTDPTADAEPQLLKDEQRGSVRGLRSEEAVTDAKPRNGISKLMAKFRKPKAEVTQASHTEVDKTQAGQLAQVDRMRDTALRTGDQKMLTKADALEKQIRAKAKAPARTK